MNKIIVIYSVGFFLATTEVIRGKSWNSMSNQASRWGQFVGAEAFLVSEDVQSLQQITAQWRDHMNRTYRSLFHVMQAHITSNTYTESAWWWLAPSQVHLYCDHEEDLLFALARTSLMGLSAEVVVQRLEEDRERAFFLISQLNGLLSPFEPGGWLASYADQATSLRVLREDCMQLSEKLAFFKDYIGYHRAYFALYMSEDQCWKQYARELQTYRSCNGDFARFKVALHDIYLYEFRVRPQWNSVTYLSDMGTAIATLRAVIANTPYHYVARVGAARELVSVLTYLQEVAFELGW